MSVTTQKYLVASLSLLLAAALVVVGSVDERLRAAFAAGRPAASTGPLNPMLDRGRQAFEKYSCNACHGTAGAGGINNLNAQTGGKINGLRLVAESYTKAELVKKIFDGVGVVEKADPNGPVPPLAMPAYRTLMSSQEADDLADYLFSLNAGKKTKAEQW